MILIMIGVRATQRREQLCGYKTTVAEDVPRTVRTRTFTDECTISFATTELIDTRSMLPLALQCRFNEALLMHKAMCLIESLPRVIPLAARVDGIYFSADKEAADELEAKASRYHYDVSERCVFQIKKCKLSELPKVAQT